MPPPKAFERIIPCLLKHLVVASSPWGEGGRGGNSKIFLCLHMVVFLQCVSVSKFHLPIRTSIIGLEPTLIQYDFILTCLHLQRPNFQIDSHSQVLSEYEWGGGGVQTSQPSIGSENLTKFSHFLVHLGSRLEHLIF